MAKKTDKPAKKSTANSTKGGKRAGAGRKPKAVKELKAALISEPVSIPPALGPSGPIDPAEKATAADYAFRLFVAEMRNEDRTVDLRLDCAREVMNRTWGKPMQAVEVGNKDGEPLKIVLEYADAGSPPDPPEAPPGPAAGDG